MDAGWFKAHYLIVAVVAFVGFWLLRLGTGAALGAAGQVLVLVIGLALFVAAAVVLFRDYRAAPEAAPEPLEPGFAHFLFHDPRSAPLWLGARLYLGYEWLESGREKLGEAAWTDGGSALRGFWERAVAIPEQGRPPIAYGWYREFLQFMLDREWYAWFAWVIVVGELLVGLGLIVGALTAIAAFFGALMNVSFMLAGTASTNPVLFSLAIALILAWRVAGLLGLDRWLLPALGVPWRAGVPAAGAAPGRGSPYRPTEA